MADVNPYLIFDGNCADAMRFYERILSGKLKLLTFGEMPGEHKPPPGSEKRIAHARLDLDDGVLMASDSMPGVHQYEGMKGFSVSLTYADVAKSKRIYDALSEGAKHVTMPFQKTFWSEGFGMFTDRFGTPWMVNTEGAGG